MGLIALLVIGALAPGAVRAERKTAVKHLIEFGWDEPDTAFMRQHVAEMERTPFDGCVFHVTCSKSDGTQASFTWDGWGRRAFTALELQPAVDDLRATRFRRFTHNFLRFNTTPGDVDWFDDFSAILNNARLAARVAHEGKCRGLLFDIEQYNTPLFDYRRQRDSSAQSWNAYAAQVRRRGEEVMTAFQQGFPGLTVFLTFGYSLPWSESDAGKKPLAECHYGLLAPFLDGMVAAARGRSRLVDGCELSYGFKDTAHFESMYRTMKEGLLPIVAEPEKYHRVFSAGFGIWLDEDWRRKGWNVEDVTKNYYTPVEFEASVRRALEIADDYVWIYTETPRWWSPSGNPEKLPAAYEEALRRARPARMPD
jgi:hypothetical protein